MQKFKKIYMIVGFYILIAPTVNVYTMNIQGQKALAYAGSTWVVSQALEGLVPSLVSSAVKHAGYTWAGMYTMRCLTSLDGYLPKKFACNKTFKETVNSSLLAGLVETGIFIAHNTQELNTLLRPFQPKSEGALQALSSLKNGENIFATPVGMQVPTTWVSFLHPTLATVGQRLWNFFSPLKECAVKHPLSSFTALSVVPLQLHQKEHHMQEVKAIITDHKQIRDLYRECFINPLACCEHLGIPLNSIDQTKDEIFTQMLSKYKDCNKDNLILYWEHHLLGKEHKNKGYQMKLYKPSLLTYKAFQQKLLEELRFIASCWERGGVFLYCKTQQEVTPERYKTLISNVVKDLSDYRSMENTLILNY